MAKKVQVIALGHPLTRETENWLEGRYGTGNVSVFYKLFHASRMDRIEDEFTGVLNEMEAIGLDLSGKTPTILVPPGASMVALVVSAMLKGITRATPLWLNLIRRGDNVWYPSPELPVYYPDSLGRAMRQARARKANVSVSSV